MDAAQQTHPVAVLLHTRKFAVKGPEGHLDASERHPVGAMSIEYIAQQLAPRMK